MEQKYKKGERVKVKVGHLMWVSSGHKKYFDKSAKLLHEYENGTCEYDIRPELTEVTATVEYTYGQMSETDNRFSKGEGGYKEYSLRFDKYGLISWFNEDDLIPQPHIFQ